MERLGHGVHDASTACAGRPASASVSAAEGALIWANGTLAEPVATGPYPLVDLDAAIARLSDQNGMWGYGGGDVLAVDAKAAEEAATDEVARDRTADDVQTMPEPIDDGTDPPTAEPVVATLVDVKADLWWVWDADGSVWLLPAYTFTDSNGNAFTVPAVTDEFMIVVEADDRAAARTGARRAGRSGRRRPADLRDVGRAAGSDRSSTSSSACRWTSSRRWPSEYGFTTRVARQDGVDQPMTMDYSDSRVNVAVEGDIVTEIVSHRLTHPT